MQSRDTFRADVARQLSWLRAHRSPGERLRLRAALTSFKKRVAAHAALGYEIERDGADSYRVFHIGAGLPYLVWYVYDVADLRGAVDLLMLLHVAQDRERFDAQRFD